MVDRCKCCGQRRDKPNAMAAAMKAGMRFERPGLPLSNHPVIRAMQLRIRKVKGMDK